MEATKPGWRLAYGAIVPLTYHDAINQRVVPEYAPPQASSPK